VEISIRKNSIRCYDELFVKPGSEVDLQIKLVVLLILKFTLAELMSAI